MFEKVFDQPDELQPWVVLEGGAFERLSLWRIQGSGSNAVENIDALAIFSSEAKANSYADALPSDLSTENACRVQRLKKEQALRIFIEYFKLGISHVVLDPTQNQASKVFSLSDVLKSARELLRGSAEL